MYLETDELSQTSANVKLARQKLQEAYDKSSASAQLKEEEVFYDLITYISSTKLRYIEIKTLVSYIFLK